MNVSVYGTPNRRHTFGRGTFFFAWCACSSIVTITCFLRALGVGCKPSVWGHRRICSKTYFKRLRGTQNSDFAGPKPLFERFGRPDVVAIEADVLPAERSDVGEQRVGQRFALGAKLGRAASTALVPRSRSVTCSRSMSPTKAACQTELGRSTLYRDIQARDHA